MMATTSSMHWPLSRLLAGFAQVSEELNVEVSGISQTHLDAHAGDLFLALAGKKVHGMQFCKDLEAIGVAAIGWEPAPHFDITTQQLPNGLTCVRIENLSSRLGELAARFYGHPSKKLRVLAVTGTDGKSSVTHFIAQALNSLAYACGVIGTLGAGRPEKLRAVLHTTPPPTVLQRELHKLLTEDGCSYAAIEASSHGLDQDRLNATQIDTAILTNITRDHFDYHGDVQSYINAKARLFFDHHPSNSILNIDDVTGVQWAGRLQDQCRVITYSCQHETAKYGTHLYAQDVCMHAFGIRFMLRIDSQSYPVEVPLYGLFNIYNVLAVAATLLSQDILPADIIRALSRLQPVTGRMQVLAAAGQPTVVIDYAHTPAALESALTALRQHFNDGSVYCVFGCGGNRDRGKRAQMGDVAARLADHVFLTSDNPRDEDPGRIIEDICANRDHVFRMEPDRLSAIQAAFHEASVNDVILIAGKGHENYQEIAGRRIAFSDCEQVCRIFSEASGNG